MAFGYVGAVNRRAGNREQGLRSERRASGDEVTDDCYEVTRPSEQADELSTGEEIATSYLGKGGSSLTGCLFTGRERGKELCGEKNEE